ncbi:hypothetical protein AB838_09450 [Rhodobacteraceae bacterium (ex Bugula neritina AB1)]|nr:hypothetical protein AB838_09450 [Rhodobacteraceae bacterium (ex Bugula neritina AB1)]
MPKLSALCRLFARLLLAAGAVLAAAPAYSGGSWQWHLTPFVLAPSIESTTELGRTGGDVEIDAGDAFGQLQAGGMLQFEGFHSSNFGFRLRYSILDADADGAGSGGAAVVRFDQNLGEAVVAYRFDRGGAQLEVFGGVRHWDVDVAASLPGGTLHRGADWSDVIAGMRWERRLSEDLSLALEGDISLAGGAEDSWSAMGGVIYDRWEQASVYVMCRGLGVEFQEGTPGTAGFFRHDAVTYSLLAGVGFRF